jgi:hypothetical protein
LLGTLEEAGIASQSRSGAAIRYRYSPTAELADLLDQVAHQYSTNLSGVTNLIHSTVSRRAYDFANAFRWRKDS